NDLNPPAGFLTSWNNKQAPQFRSNDRQFSYGPVFRSQMLDVRIRAAITAGPIDRADLVDAMGDAGTVDLRGQEDLPLLLQVLGLPVMDPFSRTYCGNGVLAACRAALWHAMDQAAADLEAEFGDPNVANWKRVPADEEIQHSAVGVTSVPPIDWINRPTFQQV